MLVEAAQAARTAEDDILAEALQSTNHLGEENPPICGQGQYLFYLS